MTSRGWLLICFILAGVAHLTGLATSSPLLPGAELLAWALLAAYVLVGGGTRLPAGRLLLTAVLVLTLSAAWDWLTTPDPGAVRQFLAPAPDAAGDATAVGAFAAGLGSGWRPRLAVALLIAAAVTRHAAAPPGGTPPIGRRAWPLPAILVAGVGAAVVIGYIALEIAERTRLVEDGRPVHLVAMALPGLLAALAAVVAAGYVLLGPRPAPRAVRISLGAGLLLLGMTALAISSTTMGVWRIAYARYDEYSAGALWTSAVALSSNTTFPTAMLSQFAGVALIAVGCLAGSRSPATPADATGSG
ncbi:hypothetical protein [Polymorphospora rubra]|uniref:hypothetical protein n=1 Tax=Polymorphospora rubra TaxID=338584 RepID=UPI001BB3274F|nr:hypothetical protein [Polymorphospora rubra]